MDYSHPITQGIHELTVSLPDDFPHPFDKWLASSALQKSIRRNYLHTALLMTRAFLQHDAAYFWRRIPIIALEDIGLGDVGLVNEILWVSGKLAWIRQQGEEKVAAYLVARMCSAAKCRNAAEGSMAADWHQDFRELRQQVGRMQPQELLALMNTDCLHTRILAVWGLLGTKRYHAQNLHSTGVELEEAIALFSPDPAIADTLRLSRSKGVEAMPVALLALSLAIPESARAIQTHPCVNSDYLGIYPLVTFDQYTRAGKKALLAWSRENPRLKRFFARHVPESQRMHYLGIAHFAVETENCALRLTYPRWEQPLRKAAEGALLTDHFTEAHLDELLAILEEELMSLNEFRQRYAPF